jgi:phage protein D/phage baseplate assembly protein gpV
MPAQAEQHVPGTDVSVGGSPLDPALKSKVTEIRVRDSRKSPSWAVIRIADPSLEHMDSHPFEIGKEMEVKFAGLGDRGMTSVFKGEVVALEPEFEAGNATIVVRAYDKTHRLARGRKIRSFTQEKASDMVQKLTQEAGLQGSATATTQVYETFMQQNETDLEFIRRLERRHDYEFSMRDGQYEFRPATKQDSGNPITVRYGQDILSFRPRVSAAQAINDVTVRGWSVKDKKEVVGTASSPAVPAELGMSLTSLKSARGTAPKHIVSDLTVADQGEATGLAQAMLDSATATTVEAEGAVFGNPKLRAGQKIDVQGLGTKLSGKYFLTSVTHIYRSSGFQTHFVAAGRSDRGMLDLISPREPERWGRGLVIGLVTNVNDPDKMGRVKLKFPALVVSGQPPESDWARVTSLMASNKRGVWMQPQVDDEVVVAFENDDIRRPIVLGAVFNGRDKGGDDLLQNSDGSFAVLATEKGFIKTAKDLTIKSDEKMIIEITSDQTNTVKGKQDEKISGNFTHQTDGSGSMKSGSSYTIEAGSTLTLKGVSVSIEASGSLKLKGATVDIESQGPATLKGLTVDVQGSTMTNIKGALINLG